MEDFDRPGEFVRVRDHYRGLTDSELLTLARQKSELTDVAQQALAGEISSRRLKLDEDEPLTPPRPEPPPEQDPTNPNYDEDRQLVSICTVWSRADALRLQNVLDTAGIPFYIGPEKAPAVDAVKSNFAEGVSVQIMSIGVPWARLAMKGYFPVDDKAQEDEEELDEASVRCPKCHSSEIVLEEAEPVRQEGDTPQVFKWTCDSCGHHWEDDGVEAPQSS